MLRSIPAASASTFFRDEPLFDDETWPARTEDKEWIEGVLKTLTDTGVDQKHVSAIKAAPLSARFRPEEVAGAITENEIPVSFTRATFLGREILKDLDSKESLSPTAMPSAS